MTLKEKLIAVVSFLLSCTLVGIVWLGIAGFVNVFLESPVLAPFFEVGFFWMLFYAAVDSFAFWLWLRLPFKYNRKRFDLWIFACFAPVGTIFAATGVVVGVRAILGLLALCFIGLLFVVPCVLPFLAATFFFSVLTGLIDIGE